MVVSLNYCSQNRGNLCRAPYYNGNPNIGPRIIGNLDQSSCAIFVSGYTSRFVRVIFAQGAMLMLSLLFTKLKVSSGNVRAYEGHRDL